MSKETTDIATKETAAALDAYKSFGVGALDSLGSNDLVIPRYKLIQNTSRTGTPGKWVSNLAPTVELDELDIIIYNISNFRTYFAPIGENDNKPLCRSNDGYIKADIDGVGASKCDNCQYAVWGKDGQGNTVVPPCKLGYTLFGCIVLPDGTRELGFVSFKGASIKPLKTYFTRMKTKGLAPFTYVTKVGVEAKVDTKGRYFQPNFDFGDLLDISDVQAIAEEVKNYTQIVSADMMAETYNDTGDSITTSYAVTQNTAAIDENIGLD